MPIASVTSRFNRLLTDGQKPVPRFGSTCRATSRSIEGARHTDHPRTALILATITITTPTPIAPPLFSPDGRLYALDFARVCPPEPPFASRSAT